MPRKSREPLRELTKEEQEKLKRVARSRSEAAEVVGRAKSLLAVAKTGNFAAGARAGGRKSSYGVGKLVIRFNQTGLNALETQQRVKSGEGYTQQQRQEVLAEFRRVPDREQDGTGTWSLTTLQGAVRKRSGLEKMSRYTISGILHEGGLSWQRDRTWCETGVSVRKGKHGQRLVVDPDAEAKKT
jgi:hypothetical protein